MNEHTKMLLEEFKSIRPKYLELEDLINSLLIKLFKENGLIVNIESRVKTIESLEGKLDLKGYKYKKLNDVTDLIGLRVITFYEDEVDKVAAIIENTLNIDRKNSVDKRKLLEQNEFGYLSLHFICYVPKELYFDENHPELNDVPIEIQMRTILQHAWANINHDIGYKSEVEIPKEYARRFSRLASLLEIADNEFCKIRNEVDEYRNKVLEVVKSGKFDEAELTIDSFKEYLTLKPFDKLTKKIASINKADIEEMNLIFYLYPLKLFGFKSLGDLEKLRSDYFDDAYALAQYQIGATDIDILSSSVGINYLCYAYLIRNGYGETDVKMFLDMLYGERKYNVSLAKNIIEISKKIGW